MTRGIILAGGLGTRLFPATKAVAKSLLPIYDKPMIYYPLSTLIKAGIKDVLIIVSNKLNLLCFMNLLGNGRKFGLSIQYKIQDKPNGIAEAFLLGEDFIGTDDVVLILGDNIFYGSELDSILEAGVSKNCIFGCKVEEPSAYGVAKLDGDDIIDVVEKPKEFISHWAVPGLYFYDNTVVKKAKMLEASDRGELEISDINKLYIKQNKLNFIKLIDTFWLDAGTHDGLMEASQFVQAVQKRTGLQIGSIELVD